MWSLAESAHLGVGEELRGAIAMRECMPCCIAETNHPFRDQQAESKQRTVSFNTLCARKTAMLR